MKNFVLYFKGLIIGMGAIIPGVSGGMLAITLGLYDKCVAILSNFFNNFKSNIKFLLPIFLGIITSVLLISKLINLLLLHFYVPTMFLFIGLILGAFKTSVQEINFKSKYIILSVIIIIILTTLTFIKVNDVDYNIIVNFSSFIKLIFVGITYAFATVVPGVSSTALMIMLGYYSLIIDIISNLTNLNKTLSYITIIIPLAIGLIIGVILFSKLMDYLFKNKRLLTNYIIFGLVCSSIISMMLNVLSCNFSFIILIISILLMIIGYKLISLIS